MSQDKLIITSVEQLVGSLPVEEKALFHRLYTVSSASGGGLKLPEGMQTWAKMQFGSLAAITEQKIVRVTNRITLEETIFNPLRGLRPGEARQTDRLEERLKEAIKTDIFANPREMTPENSFGRVIGKHCITASNVARYEGLHGLVIFNEFNPLKFSREQVVDYLDTAWKWAGKTHDENPAAKYLFLTWNCLWRAGASIYHGHAHISLAKGHPYAKIEALRRQVGDYAQRTGSNYFDDLFNVHRSLDCAIATNGVKILAPLTPFKDNELMIIGDRLDLPFKEMVYKALAFFRDRLGVKSFNLSLVTPPLSPTEESWQGFPVLCRLVDRGSLESRTSDIGGVEIYAASVVSSDPFELFTKLRNHLK
jgi:hypothetical protein